MPSMYELREFAGDAPQRRFTRRARLRGRARVGFRPGEWQSYQHRPHRAGSSRTFEPEMPEVTVIDTSDEAVWRVMYESWWRRLLLWVDAEDVLTVAREHVLVQLEPGPRALSGDIVTGVEVKPGCILDGLDHFDNRSLWAEVRGGDWRFDFAGWIPRAAFGKTFAAWNRGSITANARIRTHADVGLYERPRGGLLGMFRNNHWEHSICVVGRPRAGLAPIRYHGEDFEATGFMERTHIRVDRNASTGYGHMSDYDRNSAILYLPRGTCLYSHKDGEPVGVCLDDSREAVSGVDDGWWHIPRLGTSWRTFDVWVQDDGPAAAPRDSSPSSRVIYRKLQRCQP